MSARSRVELGAHVEPDGVRFGVFAQADRSAIEFVDMHGEAISRLELEPSGDGLFSGFSPGTGPGARYFVLVNGKRLPDPYARCLPRGVHGPAEVVASSYVFQHQPLGRALDQQIIYELHIGTFTEEGTFEAARKRLPALVALGVTTLELMPVAAFAGERGWGYDGVALYAPHAAYGTPDQLRELVDAAHGLGLSVLLDVVYNHFGPSGNYLPAFSPRYFSESLKNAWGQAPNFAEPALRRLVLDNARYWLSEFQLDGLRLDATHAIIDPSAKHVLRELVELAHGLTPPRLLIAEDERNEAPLVTEVGLDGLWADDFHHQVRVTLTGERAGYYGAFEPSPQGIADVINRGWLYAGQVNPVTGKPRGSSAAALRAESLVYCIQNHDQVGNRALGDRLLPNVAFRSASLLLLFLPMTPLLFMGQEWGASSPFLYFTDHEPELGKLVSEGRRREFAGFPEFAAPEGQSKIPDPQDRSTFLASKLRWEERERPEHAQTLELYRSALQLRRTDPVLSGSDRSALVAQASEGALVVQRWRGNQRRVLVWNLSERELPLAELSRRLKLGALHTLLCSTADAGDALPPRGAIVLGGRGTLVGLSEGAI